MSTAFHFFSKLLLDAVFARISCSHPLQSDKIWFGNAGLFEKSDPRESGNARQFRLRSITSDEHFRADVLRRGYVDKIPGSGGGIFGMTRAQFIAPFQKIGQTMNYGLQPLRSFTGAISVPGDCRVFAGKTAEIVPQFNTQQRIPKKFRRAFAAPQRHRRRKFIRRIEPREQRGSVGVNSHRRRRRRS